MITYGAIKSGEAAVPVAKVDANSIPSLIDRASRRLAEAKTSAEVLEAKAAAELALHYAKVTKAANESHADCLRIITRAEIRMASEIDRGQAAGEVAKPGRTANVPASDNRATLADLGVSRQRVGEWRKVAEAGEEKVEQAISEALAEGRAPTKADVHRAAGVVKDKPETGDADREYSDLQAAWDRAGPLARRHFLAWNDLLEQPKAGTHGAEACKPNSNAVDIASINIDGRANAGGSDVDRSVERASSAVEVGATNSPDGANELLGGLPVPATEVNVERTGRSSAYTRTGRHGTPHVSGETGGETPSDTRERAAAGSGVTAGETASNSHSQPVATDQLADAKPADTAAAETSPVPLPPAAANPFNNPRCQKPETCHLVHSRNECFDCTMAWAKRPRDEQVRLWAEAIQAARAA
ncbi:hypothetical protein ACHMW4_04220 [Mesorhizobium sp. UC22_110]|uniref:hypothetical protein n=1 Tax=unclassified Mesorhizobium TaxID=325217 RepID=UPI00366B0919